MAALGEMVRAACSKRGSLADLARVGGDVPLAGWRVSGRRAPSGWEWQGSQSSQGVAELGFPGPALGQMQGEATRRAGEPCGEGEEPPPEGLGGHHRLAQPEPRGPASEVVGHHPVSSTGQALHRQPGGVGGETPRGKMVESDAVLEVSNGVLDLGVAAMVGFQFQGLPSRSVMKP